MSKVSASTDSAKERKLDPWLAAAWSAYMIFLGFVFYKCVVFIYGN